MGRHRRHPYIGGALVGRRQPPLWVVPLPTALLAGAVPASLPVGTMPASTTFAGVAPTGDLPATIPLGSLSWAIAQYDADRTPKGALYGFLPLKSQPQV
ncbi:hypothetical protein BHM03_00059810 [Ensete ventricosum]|nr:hypothetical protein BHM03_00059810 [Ensete ventricosum]